jgi:hypothetical protein
VADGADGADGAVGTDVLAFADADKLVERVVGLDRHDLRPALTVSFDLLADRSAILDAVRSAVDGRGQVGAAAAGRALGLNEPQRGFLRFAVPAGTPAYEALYAGGACYLVVPVQPDLEQDLLRHSQAGDPWERARVAHQLGNYSDREAVERLGQLLLDPARMPVQTLSGGRRTERSVQPAAQVAFDSLTELGVAVDQPDGWVEDFPHLLIWPGSAALAG